MKGLVKLLPFQVEENWDWLGDLIAQSLPPLVTRSDNGMVNILTSLMLEKGDCWIYYNDRSVPTAIITTTDHIDSLAEIKSLLIYTFTSLGDLTKEDYQKGFNTLMRYAKAKGYSSIVAYSNLRSIVNLVRSSGGRAEYILIEKEV